MCLATWILWARLSGMQCGLLMEHSTSGGFSWSDSVGKVLFVVYVILTTVGILLIRRVAKKGGTDDRQV